MVKLHFQNYQYDHYNISHVVQSELDPCNEEENEVLIVTGLIR